MTLFSVAIYIGFAVGPILGGLVVAAAGPWAVFLLNALSFVGIIVFLHRWRTPSERKLLPPEQVIGADSYGIAIHASFIACTCTLGPRLCNYNLWQCCDIAFASLGSQRSGFKFNSFWNSGGRIWHGRIDKWISDSAKNKKVLNRKACSKCYSFVCNCNDCNIISAWYHYFIYWNICSWNCFDYYNIKS